jgi:predicted dithiol-disulfide oxidoreductase (DUF899 family)
MTEHQTGTQEEWQAARDELLGKEKEHTRLGDELAKQRRELPWVPVEKEYSFETDAGTKTLAELFDGRSQLMIYHFMFGPPYEAGCPACSSIADNLDANAPHLNGEDVTMLLVSRGPLDKLRAYKERMGWALDWVSTAGSDFNRDLGFTVTEEELRPFLEELAEQPQGHLGLQAPPTVEQQAEACGTDVVGYASEVPGLSAYALSDGVVCRTYVTTARGLEPAMGYYGLLDLTPKGRHESADEPIWLRRHDEY